MIKQVTFETTGMKRPSEDVPGPSQLATSAIGEFYIGEYSLKFCEWEIPYDRIKSAVLRTEYNLTFPSHTLLIADDFANYLFNIPREYVDISLPFSVRREIYGSWWNRYGFVVTSIVLIVAVLVTQFI